MINFHPHKILTTLGLLLAITSAMAQTTVKITPDKTAILIGEPIKLMLEADIPENEAIGFFNPDSIPHFEILRRDKIDTSNTSKGTILKGAIYITSFDSGHWVIPPLLLRDSIYTDSIPVDVGYTPFDISKPYNDIKDLVEADAEKKESPLKWWYFVAGAVALLLIIYFAFRGKKKPLPAPVAEEDVYLRAIRELDELGKEQMAKDLYYSRLVNIFRLYVLKRRGIDSMQQTTGDLVEQLKGVGLPADLYRELSSALRFSDLVKFARFDASAQDDERTRQTVLESIRMIEEVKPVVSEEIKKDDGVAGPADV
ncbi:MAG: hypothetical protein ABWZ25_14700 [Chitinophagaceae bacterium]